MPCLNIQIVILLLLLLVLMLMMLMMLILSLFLMMMTTTMKTVDDHLRYLSSSQSLLSQQQQHPTPSPTFQTTAPREHLESDRLVVDWLRKSSAHWAGHKLGVPNFSDPKKGLLSIKN
jgi:hypothetical protein